MKIALAHAYFLAEDRTEQTVMKPYPPLGLLYISGFLKMHQVDHQLFDSTFNLAKDLEQFVLAEKPEIIGLYVNFLTRGNVIRLIDFIRRSEDLKESTVILGGPDVRFNSAHYLDHGADYLIPGEGEQAFYELISALKTGEPVEDIKGIEYRKGKDEIARTPERPMERDLSTLPLPNRKGIDMTPYMDAWRKNQGYSSLTINTQRGCPFSCNWCSHAVFGDTYRRRPAVLVIEELEMLVKEYGPDSFWFVDDVFTMSEGWIYDFQRSLESKNLQISYECITRADKLSEDIIRSLKDTGCQLLWIGAESGSQKVLDLMDRRVKAQQVRDMIRLAGSYGIKTGTFIMLGYPGEEQVDIEETIRHLKSADPDYFTINLAYPIKGTRLYKEVEPTIISKGNWAATPDRDLDFNRIYNRRYYDFAIRRIYNEVYAHREKMKGNSAAYLKHSLKSVVSRAAMQFYNWSNFKK